jgi:MarR family transcriptional regulator, 2-MHQ and catechol-resistance regulon repressor
VSGCGAVGCAGVSEAGAGSADAEAAADARALHLALSALLRVVQYRDRDRICCHDVSVSQCHALEEVLARGPLTLGELAAVLYLDKSTASRVVSGLIEKRYVERRDHPEDARAVQLEATESGRRLAAQIESEMVAEAQALLGPVAPEVRRAMVTLLERLARAVANRAGVSCSCSVGDA